MIPSGSFDRRGLLGSALASLAAALVATGAASLVLAAALGLSALYAAKVLAPLGLGALALLLYLPGHHPFARLGPANQVTIGRAALVALLVGLAGEPQGVATALLAIGLGLLAMLLDGLDGRLARRTGMASALGVRLDLETDALLVLALAVLAWDWDKAGAWVLLGGALRYAFIAAGWLDERLRAPLPPSRRRAAVGIVHLTALLCVLLPPVHPPVSSAVAAASLAALAVSFCIDTLALLRAGAPAEVART